MRLSVAVLLIVGSAAAAQDRRDRREPALVLETEGRTGACDVLAFSPDGTRVLAAGDDKVVSIWSYADGRLDPKSLTRLRWPIWREQRGAIYALAQSPNDGGARVAVGGFGLRGNGTVAVLQRDTGKMLAATFPEEGQTNFFAVTAVTWFPTGDAVAFGTGDGSVWRWNLADPKPHRLGTHRRVPGRPEINWVRLVRVIGDAVVSIAEDCQVMVWGAQSGPIDFKFDPGVRTVRAAALTADSRRLACGLKDNTVVVFETKAQTFREIKLPIGHFPRGLAFDPDGDRLAVAVGSRVPGSRFFIDADEPVVVFDLTQDPPKESARLNRSGRAEAIAWRDRDRLAVAGGDAHEVATWDLTKPGAPTSVARGDGTAIWGVGLSDNGRYLLFQDERKLAPTHANDRGAGTWRVFDTKDKKFVESLPAGVNRVAPVSTLDGWAVEPNPADPYSWNAVAPSGQRHPLDLDRSRDGMPTCYTFVKRREAPPLLAVGHYWGLSVFDLSAAGPVKTRVMTGHQGEVMALAPSAAGDRLVSASNDQTISVWSLKDWPSKSLIGAAVTPAADSLTVGPVDVGSPAWEAGLVEGDSIVSVVMRSREPPHVFRANGPIVYKAGDREYREPPGPAGSVAAAAELLRRPDPGKEIFLVWRRAGQPFALAQPTTVRTRPAWRFFPARTREWVLWMWQGNFYDCSDEGDKYIAWHLNDQSLQGRPQVVPLDWMRRVFYRDDVIDELLGTGDVAAALTLAAKIKGPADGKPLPVNFEKVMPPPVQLALSSEVADEPITAVLTAGPRDDNPDLLPHRVELWINDFRWQQWFPNGAKFEQTVTIPPDLLRAGENRLTLQAFNRSGGRTDAVRAVRNPRKAAAGRLFGLPVGINDYSQSAKTPDGARNVFGPLKSAVNDAKRHAAVWGAQPATQYTSAGITLKLDRDARRDEILKALAEVRARAKPDDQLLVLLAGHGDFRTAKGGTTFVFCGPDYDPARFKERGLDSETLFEELATIQCRKVVFLDACHAGEAAYSPVRLLTPDGQGPTILAACGRSELSYEHDGRGNGVFTCAVLETLEKGFDAADADRDGKLDAGELIAAVRKRMPDLLREIKKPPQAQNPVCFPRVPEKHGLFQKP